MLISSHLAFGKVIHDQVAGIPDFIAMNGWRVVCPFQAPDFLVAGTQQGNATGANGVGVSSTYNGS